MSKGQSYGEMYPSGICVFCKKPCEEDGTMHYECAVSYDEIKHKKLEEEKCHSCGRKLPLGQI